MITAIANAFRIPDLRKKILFTLMIIALYRVGAYIPAPGVSVDKVFALIQENSALSLLGLFSGGALEKLAVFSLGVMPYITASIIMQLLQGVIPQIEAWSKEGETGQRKITQITRYMTLGIGLVEAVGLLGVFKGAIVTPAGMPGGLLFTQFLIVLALV
ncbi:MAG: preprotein translocase subunit SecY, partial [Actinobacteria bacterium]